MERGVVHHDDQSRAQEGHQHEEQPPLEYKPARPLSVAMDTTIHRCTHALVFPMNPKDAGKNPSLVSAHRKLNLVCVSPPLVAPGKTTFSPEDPHPILRFVCNHWQCDGQSVTTLGGGGTHPGLFPSRLVDDDDIIDVDANSNGLEAHGPQCYGVGRLAGRIVSHLLSGDALLPQSRQSVEIGRLH